jgi:hypothetical protein
MKRCVWVAVGGVGQSKARGRPGQYSGFGTWVTSDMALMVISPVPAGPM